MLSAEARPKVAVEGIGQMWQLALEQIGDQARSRSRAAPSPAARTAAC